MLAAFAQLWIHGVDVDLDQLTGTGRRRVRLPTYSFDHERHWIEPGDGWALGAAGPVGSGPAVPERIANVDEMGFRPTWITAPDRPAADVVRRWVVVGGQSAADVADELRRRGRAVELRTRLGQMDDDDAQSESEPCGVVLVGEGASMEHAASLWLDDATAAAKWLGSSATAGRLVAVTRGALTVDAPARTPVDALGLGVVMVGRREYAGLSTLLIDSDPEHDLDVTALVDEVESATGVIAVRDGRRLTPHLQLEPPAEIAPVDAFRHGGTYLITGALGGIGEELAVHLATRHAANLVLVSSEPIPPAAERERFLRSHTFDHPTCRPRAGRREDRAARCQGRSPARRPRRPARDPVTPRRGRAESRSPRWRGARGRSVPRPPHRNR